MAKCRPYISCQTCKINYFSGLLELNSEADSKVRRSPAQPLPENNEETKKALEAKTAYAKGQISVNIASNISLSLFLCLSRSLSSPLFLSLSIPSLSLLVRHCHCLKKNEETKKALEVQTALAKGQIFAPVIFFMCPFLYASFALCLLLSFCLWSFPLFFCHSSALS